MLFFSFFFFFFNDPATTEIYPLSLPDALPISVLRRCPPRCGAPRHHPHHARAIGRRADPHGRRAVSRRGQLPRPARAQGRERSEEHTSELQSPCNLVCRLLLEKKKRKKHVRSQHTRC